MILQNIQQLCTDKGLSILSLEKAVGLGNGTIGKWGKTSPRIDSLQRVANYFGVTIDELLVEHRDSA